MTPIKNHLRVCWRHIKMLFYALIVRLLPKELLAMAIVYHANKLELNSETPLLILFGLLDGLL